MIGANFCGAGGDWSLISPGAIPRREVITYPTLFNNDGFYGANIS